MKKLFLVIFLMLSIFSISCNTIIQKNQFLDDALNLVHNLPQDTQETINLNQLVESASLVYGDILIKLDQKKITVLGEPIELFRNKYALIFKNYVKSLKGLRTLDFRLGELEALFNSKYHELNTFERDLYLNLLKFHICFVKPIINSNIFQFTLSDKIIDNIIVQPLGWLYKNKGLVSIVVVIGGMATYYYFNRYTNKIVNQKQVDDLLIKQYKATAQAGYECPFRALYNAICMKVAHNEEELCALLNNEAQYQAFYKDIPVQYRDVSGKLRQSYDDQLDDNLVDDLAAFLIEKERIKLGDDENKGFFRIQAINALDTEAKRVVASEPAVEEIFGINEAQNKLGRKGRVVGVINLSNQDVRTASDGKKILLTRNSEGEVIIPESMTVEEFRSLRIPPAHFIAIGLEQFNQTEKDATQIETVMMLADSLNIDRTDLATLLDINKLMHRK